MLPPRNLVFGFFESEEPFPIDFDEAWQWIGYSQKGHAKTAFEKGGFIEGTDFFRDLEKSSGGRRPEKIYLTVECFKMFCMMAGTAKGREVRLYFLDCEKELKARVASDKERREVRVLEAYVMKNKLPWKKKFEDEFYYQIYRLKGWEYDPDTARRTPLLGKITNDIVYMRLQPGVLEELRKRNPRQKGGRRRHCHHQFLTANIGNPHLRFHLSKLIMFMSKCNTWKGFTAIIDRFLPRTTSIQPDIFFELLEAGHIDFDEWERLVS